MTQVGILNGLALLGQMFKPVGQLGMTSLESFYYVPAHSVIGASLEFVAGAQPRAPVWMQRAGLEWAHRLLRDPRRLARRYLMDSPSILPMLLRERLAASAR